MTPAAVLPVAAVLSSVPEAGWTLPQVSTVLMLMLNVAGLVWGAAMLKAGLDTLRVAVQKAEAALDKLFATTAEQGAQLRLHEQWRDGVDRQLAEQREMVHRHDRQLLQLDRREG